MKLTRQAQSVFSAIRSHFADHGEAPAIKQICGLTGIRLECQVIRHLDALQEAGLIVRERHKKRSIQLVELPHGCCPNCGHQLEARALC